MSVNSSYSNQSDNCLYSFAIQLSTAVYAIIKVIIFLPLCVLVISVGRRQWRQLSPGATLSHSDILTYHSVAVEILHIIVAILNFCITQTSAQSLMIALLLIFSVSFPGQLLYSCLTCIDRYLAVVHPIVYLRLRSRNAVKIIHMSSGFALLLSAAGTAVVYVRYPFLGDIPSFVTLIVSLVVVSFCSLSVVHTLKHSGPGEGGRSRQFKQRAFNTTMAILIMLLVWLVGILVGFTMNRSNVANDQCLPVTIAFFFSLPGNSVTPLLFLHRAGKLPCCLYNSE